MEIILDGYWQTRPGFEMKAAILADWMDELEDWHVDQIRWALRKWRGENPSRKPNPGHIAQILKRQRGEVHAHMAHDKEVRQLFSVSRPLSLAAE